MNVWKSTAWIALKDRAIKAMKQNILNINLAHPGQAQAINTLAIEQLRREVEQLKEQKQD